MKILLAIRPEFADRIFDGSKKFEFRKTIFKLSHITKVLVYASSPIQKIVGEFEIEDIIAGKPEQLWEMTTPHTGISKINFDKYFKDKEEGYAIKIKDSKKFESPLSLQADFKISYPPQSFMYIHF